MKDFKAVSISGAMHVKKARLLIDGDHAKLFNKQGQVTDQFAISKLTRVPGTWTYSADTFYGPITITRKCFTCSGWWKVSKVPAGKLWRSQGTNA